MTAIKKAKRHACGNASIVEQKGMECINTIYMRAITPANLRELHGYVNIAQSCVFFFAQPLSPSLSLSLPLPMFGSCCFAIHTPEFGPYIDGKCVLLMS